MERNLFEYVTPAPDGASLAVLPAPFTMHRTQKLRVLSIPNWVEQRTVEVLTDSPRCLTYSPDGKSLLIGGAFDLQEWDLATGKVRRVFVGPAAKPVAFSPDGTRLASYWESAVFHCSAVTGKLVRPDLAEAGHNSPVYGVLISSDGKVIATNARNGEVRTWATDTGRPLASLKVEAALELVQCGVPPWDENPDRGEYRRGDADGMGC